MNEIVETSPIHGGESVHTTTTRSRHSSVHGPYRDSLAEENYFPLCHRTFTANGSAESYSRSMLSLGHGYPILNLIGNWNRSNLLKHGLSLGDVGLLDNDGDFAFAFNIFAPPDDPRHVNETPLNFVPLKYPDPTEVTRVPNHFPLGTVLASKGITIRHVSDSPLEFNLSSKAREGGILVLPDGASRENFVPSASLFEFIERNAVDWYSHVPNIIRGSIEFMSNGSLYLITGCDKTQSMTGVAVPSRSQYSGLSVDIQYKHDNPQQWSDPHSFRVCTYGPQRNPGAQYAVFIRGIRISLNHRTWARIQTYSLPTLRPYSNLLSTPITGRLSRIVRWYELRYGPRWTELGSHPKVPFHVSDIIAQVILKDSLDSEVVVVEDSVWMSHVDPVSGDGTASQIFELVMRALLGHDVLSNKLVRLVPRGQGQTSKPPNVFKNIHNRWRVEWKVRKVIYERPPPVKRAQASFVDFALTLFHTVGYHQLFVDIISTTWYNGTEFKSKMLTEVQKNFPFCNRVFSACLQRVNARRRWRSVMAFPLLTWLGSGDSWTQFRRCGAVHVQYIFTLPVILFTSMKHSTEVTRIPSRFLPANGHRRGHQVE